MEPILNSVKTYLHVQALDLDGLWLLLDNCTKKLHGGGMGSPKPLAAGVKKRGLNDPTVSTALLLKEVSEKVAKLETKFPKFSPKFAPKFAPEFAPKCFVLSWQVEKSSPKISPDFSHRKS